MARIKMHISKTKLPFYPPYEVKYWLQNGVSTVGGAIGMLYSGSGCFGFGFELIGGGCGGGGWCH